MPVTFAEFDVRGARPVDVFNTMLDTPAQIHWNSQCHSVESLGNFPEQGARAWAVAFDIPFVNRREFLQWQVADADYVKQDFWLAFSTQNNANLTKGHQFKDGAVDSQNCLGAYHITKTEDGAHVVISQQVNVHPFIELPLHQILDLFPAAWQGTIDFVNEMSDRARKISNDERLSETVVPKFMLEEASALPAEQWKSASRSIFLRADALPKHAEKDTERALSCLQWVAISLLTLACFILIVSVGFGAGRFAARKYETWSNVANDADTVINE